MVKQPEITSKRSITFRCPKCKTLCAFADRYAGRRARCTTCDRTFTIPDRDGGKPVTEILEQPPLPGYYRRALIESWKIFINPENAKILIFFALMVSLEYFVGFTDFSMSLPGFRLQLPIGIITVFIVRGCLFWYYFEIVASTAFEIDELPDVDVDFGFAFFWNIIKSTYLFVVAFLVPQIPMAIVAAIIETSAGITLPYIIKVPMLMVGFFLFPMAILTIAAGREIWMVFNPRMMIVPIVKAFPQYLTAALLTGAAILIQWTATHLTMGGFQEMTEEGPLVAILALIVCIATRMLNIIAMRSIGLFAQHYRCHLPQTHLVD